jgi:uncharacterized protein
MIFLLSPAKSLDYESKPPVHNSTQPLFTTHSLELVEVMRELSLLQISDLMQISDNLSKLNMDRFARWSGNFNQENSRSAIFAFNGDVYDGLNAKTLPAKSLDWLQRHLCILSGLYGVLRPMDLMQPYRLEMGLNLVTKRGNTVYKFWGNMITEYLNQRLNQCTSSIVVNLASQEYFKSIKKSLLKARIVDCVFEENRGGHYKIVSFIAKKARGMMVRYCAINQVNEINDLISFTEDGYEYAPNVSTENRLVFRKNI